MSNYNDSEELNICEFREQYTYNVFCDKVIKDPITLITEQTFY